MQFAGAVLQSTHPLVPLDPGSEAPPSAALSAAAGVPPHAAACALSPAGQGFASPLRALDQLLPGHRRL
jgi:hypothetical protein